jgi:hypothetical protein
LKGSRTEKNLITAFAGESQARNRYTYFSGKARKDGFRQMAEIFEGYQMYRSIDLLSSSAGQCFFKCSHAICKIKQYASTHETLVSTKTPSFYHCDPNILAIFRIP